MTAASGGRRSATGSRSYIIFKIINIKINNLKMQIAPLFCLNIILAIFPLISSNKFRLTSNPQEEYIFNDFSNTNCDSNFTTSLTAKT